MFSAGLLPYKDLAKYQKRQQVSHGPHPLVGGVTGN